MNTEVSRMLKSVLFALAATGTAWAQPGQNATYWPADYGIYAGMPGPPGRIRPVDCLSFTGDNRPNRSPIRR